MIDPAYAAAGALVGMLVGLTGVGGGSLMTPLLMLGFGITPAVAVGTDLLFAAGTKLAGTLAHGTGRSVEWRIVALLTAGSLPAALATTLVLRALGAPGTTAERAMSVALGVALVVTAASLLLRPWIAARLASRPLPADGTRRRALLTVATGVALGVLVTLSSVGAGAIGLTVLALLHPRLPIARLVGSDIAHAVPLTLIAGLGHWAIGDVDPRLLVSLLCGSIPAVVAGSLLATQVPERALRPFLAVILLATAARLFV